MKEGTAATKCVLVVLCCFLNIVTCNNYCSQRTETLRQCACSQKIENVNSSVYDEYNKFYYIINQQELGRIDMQLPYLRSCEYGEHQILLRMEENSTNPAECTLIRHKNWQEHSNIIYTIYEPPQCMSCQSTDMPTVTFRNVFSGCYALEIFSSVLEQPLQFPALYFNTNYKTENFENNAIDVLGNFKQNIQQIEIVINSTNLPKPPSIYTSLMPKSCYDSCMYLEAKTVVAYTDARSNYTENFRNCSRNTNVTWTCKYKGLTSYICTFEKLQPGNYSFTFSLLDGYICSDLLRGINGAFCSASYDLEVDSLETPLTVPSYDVDKPEMIIVYTCSILAIITVALVIMMIIYKRHSFCKKRNIQQIGRSDVTGTTGERLLPYVQEILLVYVKDSEQFNMMMESFTNLLKYIKNITVSDINADTEELYRQPETWIRKKVLNENTKIILFLNNRSVRLYQNQGTTEDTCQRWQDANNLFPYIIKQLQFSKLANYTKLFIAHLPNINCDDLTVFEDLNPATRYIMPNSVHRLLRDVFHFQPNVDVSSFEDFCEQCM